TDPSGLLRLLKNTKCLSDRTLLSAEHSRALASRSKSVPVVVRTSQPRPTTTAVSPGASLVSETLPPLLRLTPTVATSVSACAGAVHPRALVCLREKVVTSRRFPRPLGEIPAWRRPRPPPAATARHGASRTVVFAARSVTFPAAGGGAGQKWSGVVRDLRGRRWAR